MSETATINLEGQIRRLTPVTAPSDQQAEVVKLATLLEGIAHKKGRRHPRCKLVGPEGESIAIPESVFYVLERVAEVLARGDAITVVPVGKALTTQQAADLLNVSRQYLVRLLEQKQLPFTRTGKHRRLRIDDVLAFKQRRDRGRRAGLRTLTQMTEDAEGYNRELE